MGRRRPASRGRRGRRVLGLLSLLIAGQLVGATARTELDARLTERIQAHRQTSDLSTALQRLEARADTLETAAEALRDYHADRVEPLISILENRTRAHPLHIERIALALAREGRRSLVDPRLLVAVMLVENPWLDPTAESPVGAVGLMQVMPFHAGAWGCPGTDLTHPETNICHGTRILAEALRRTRGDLDAALLRYNGCKYGTNTPNCHEYPTWVYQYVEAEWLEGFASAALATPDRVAGGTAIQ
jgi:soluble lytic murein transglycosylase-like protein